LKEKEQKGKEHDPSILWHLTGVISCSALQWLIHCLYKCPTFIYYCRLSRPLPPGAQPIHLYHLRHDVEIYNSRELLKMTGMGYIQNAIKVIC